MIVDIDVIKNVLDNEYKNLRVNVYYFHAHIYFETLKLGNKFRNKIIKVFNEDDNLNITNIQGSENFQDLYSPHDYFTFEVLFTKNIYYDFTVWLQLYRDDKINIMIHPITENLYEDHVIHQYWYGEKINFDYNKFINKSYKETKLTKYDVIDCIINHKWYILYENGMIKNI